jgi:branched-chain amino acid transport system ATP-binding protein
MAEAGPTTAPLLAVRGVSKRFGGVHALSDVSMGVDPGDIVGLIGPNGAGKTTLFDCISGQRHPDAGTVSFDGQPLDRLPVYRRARLGVGRTFQRVELFPEMTVADHLLVALRAHADEGRLWRDLLHKSAPRPEERERVAETLSLVGIAPLAERPVAALGLGSCRLVELARALVTGPRLLLADEPSSGLDTAETAELAAVLRSVQRSRGMAVLLVEHDLAMVEAVCERVVVMHLGSVVASGPFGVVMADALVRSAYLGRPA